MFIYNKKGYDHLNIIQSCRDGNIDEVKKFMNEGFYSENDKNKVIFELVPRALIFNNKHIVNFLIIDCKFDINHTCEINGNNLLMQLSPYICHIDYIKYFIKEFDYDYNYNYKNKYNMSIFDYLTDSSPILSFELELFIEEHEKVYLKPAKK